jgi:molybdate transport system substrate-binding protein
MTWSSLAMSSTARAIMARTTATLVVLTGSPNLLNAAELRVLSAASIQQVFKQVVGDFEQTSGHTIILHYATMGAITERVRNGEQADLVISSRQSIGTLLHEQKIEAGSQSPISKVGVGVVVAAGSPAPVIATVEDLGRALAAATTIVYADPARGGAAGIHIARVIERLGLADRLKPKTVLAAGGDVTEVTLSKGEGAVGMTQISEILGKPGAVFAGPLPRALQNYTMFASGRPVGAQHPEIADALLAFLKSPPAIAAMKATGMEVD